MNGVPVIDVSALEQAAESSNESSTTAEQQNENQDTDPIAASPHFITVTGKRIHMFECFFVYVDSTYVLLYNIDVF